MSALTEYVHIAIAETHPDAFASHSYMFCLDETGEPHMAAWDEDRLGPLDLAAITARCEQIALVGIVPKTVTPLQIRKALRQTGLKADVDAYVATLDEEEREEWVYCTVVRRDHAVLNAGAMALGKTSADLDDLFRLAATF